MINELKQLNSMLLFITLNITTLWNVSVSDSLREPKNIDQDESINAVEHESSYLLIQNGHCT
jgi:hypothetical protein